MTPHTPAIFGRYAVEYGYGTMKWYDWQPITDVQADRASRHVRRGIIVQIVRFDMGLPGVMSGPPAIDPSPPWSLSVPPSQGNLWPLA